MKALQRLCAGAVLMLALAAPAFAGHIPCPGVTDPPPPSTTQDATTPATDDAGVVAITRRALCVLRE